MANNNKSGSSKSQVQAALGTNNSLSKKEVSNLLGAGIGMDKILTVAAKAGATIGQAAQNSFGVTQKNGTISYAPAAGMAAPAAGTGWGISGYQTVANPYPINNNVTAQAPVYSYFGGTTSASPSPSTPFPAVTPGQGPGPWAPGAAAPGPSTTFNDSVDSGTQALIDAMQKMLDQNAANQQLYMGMMQNMASQNTAASQQMFSGPYAVTTQNALPVPGAITTQPITRRAKNLNTSLAIQPATAAVAAGAGLNIPS